MGKSKKKSGTKQTLEYVESEFKWHVRPIKCLNERQKELINSIKNNEVTIASGMSGSGKTILALWQALKFLEQGAYKRIVLIKSVQTVPQEELGFMPGDAKMKCEPYMLSFTGNIDKLIGKEAREYLMNKDLIQVQPIAFCRGINIDESIVILDECQNISLDTFKTIITRIGKNSRYVILGDTEQIDMKYKAESSLRKILDLFADDQLIGTVLFTKDDCVRNPIIPHILEKLRTIE